MPNYEFTVTERLIERRLVTETRRVVITADDLEQARDVITELKEVDSSPIYDLDFDQELGDVLGNDFLESFYSEPRETDRPANLDARQILTD